MDNVGRPLAAVTAELAARRVPYTVTVTRPDRRSFPLAEDNLYVIRDLAGDGGERRLMAAAKMGKGV